MLRTCSLYDPGTCRPLSRSLLSEKGQGLPDVLGLVGEQPCPDLRLCVSSLYRSASLGLGGQVESVAGLGRAALAPEKQGPAWAGSTAEPG